MRGPYENNKVYAVASYPRKGLKAGYVSAVYAEKHHNQHVSPDAARGGQFFRVEPDEFRDGGGNADHWDPNIPDGYLLALPEDEEPLDLGPSHVLSTWSDREVAWAAFESRRSAGKKGAQTRAEREAAEKAAVLADERRAHEESPLGRLKATTRGFVHAFVVPARNGRPERVHVSLELTPNNFRRLMTNRGADPDLVEEFLRVENEES